MKIFKLELRRAIFNKWTGFAFIVAFIICLIPLWDKLMYMTEFYDTMSSGGGKIICTATPYENWLLYDLSDSLHYLYLFVMPLLAVLPFGASYYMDLKSGYVKQLVTRCSTKKYLCAKYGATFISGGAVISMPLLLQLMLLALIFPINKPYRFESMFISENSPGIDLYFEYPIIYCLIWCGIVFIVAGLIATISLAVTNFAYSYFSILLTPFVLAFALIFLAVFTERLEVSFLYSISALTVYSYNYWIFIGELIGIFIVTFVPYVVRRKEVL